MHRLFGRPHRSAAAPLSRLPARLMRRQSSVLRRAVASPAAKAPARSMSFLRRLFPGGSKAAAPSDSDGTATAAEALLPSDHPDFHPFPLAKLMRPPTAKRMSPPAATAAAGSASSPSASSTTTTPDAYSWLADQDAHGPDIIEYLGHENEYVEAVLDATDQPLTGKRGASRKRAAAAADGAPVDSPARRELASLFEEMSARLTTAPVATVPESAGAYAYYQRHETGADFPVFYRRRLAQSDARIAMYTGGKGGAASDEAWAVGSREEEILNVNRLFDHFAYINIGQMRFSDDHRYLAYTLDTSGAERFSVFVKDLHVANPAGDELVGVVDRIEAVHSIEWMNDSRTLLYTASDELNRPFAVRMHRVTPGSFSPAAVKAEAKAKAAAAPDSERDAAPGAPASYTPASYTPASYTPASAAAAAPAASATPVHPAPASVADREVFHERDASVFVDVRRTKDHHFVIISAHSKTTTEIRVLPASLTAAHYLAHSSQPWSSACAATGAGADDAAPPLAQPYELPASGALVLAARQTGTEYYIEHYRGFWYFGTNAQGARNYKLVRVPVHLALTASDAGGGGDAGQAHWQTIVPARPDTRIADIEVYRSHFVVFEQTGGLPRIRVSRHWHADAYRPDTAAAPPGAGDPRAGTDEHVVRLPHPIGVVTPGHNTQYSSDVARFAFSSPILPEHVYDYDLATQKLTLRQKQTIATTNVAAGHVAAVDTTRALTCYRVLLPVTDPDAAADAKPTLIPITLVHGRHIAPLPNPSAAPQSASKAPAKAYPVLFRSYGAYGTDVDLSFKAPYLSLLARDWIIAYAHIRGGGEYGADWHAAGRLRHKQNSIRDVQACAKWLVRTGYTRPELMCAYTASAGALAVAGALNGQPAGERLFQAAVLKVPFVDPLSSMLDRAQALTAHEVEEWGDPVASVADRAYLSAYSPYQNLPTASAGMPHLFLTSAMSDPRVPYWQPARYVARLRAAAAASPTAGAAAAAPVVLFQTSFDSGHFDDGGRYSGLNVFALEWLFLLRAVGLAHTINPYTAGGGDGSGAPSNFSFDTNKRDYPRTAKYGPNSL